MRPGDRVNVRVVGAGEAAESLRSALARVGLVERVGEPAAFVCGLDDLPRAIAMRELSQVTGPIVVVTGLGVVTSLGAGKADNWAKLTAGESGIRAITRFGTVCPGPKLRLETSGAVPPAGNTVR